MWISIYGYTYFWFRLDRLAGRWRRPVYPKIRSSSVLYSEEGLDNWTLTFICSKWWLGLGLPKICLVGPGLPKFCLTIQSFVPDWPRLSILVRLPGPPAPAWLPSRQRQPTAAWKLSKPSARKLASDGHWVRRPVAWMLQICALQVWRWAAEKPNKSGLVSCGLESGFHLEHALREPIFDDVNEKCGRRFFQINRRKNWILRLGSCWSLIKHIFI